jgi:cytosine/adenosine deaminase-related metal-dependent hydrolase
MADTLTLTARYVFPVAAPPLGRGTVTIAGDRISAVEPHGARAADVDLGNVAILPGLVNAHTHLDLGGARGLIPPTPDFTQWLRGVIAYRRSRTAEQVQDDIRTGIRECLQFGATTLGDIAAEGASWDLLSAASAHSVVFWELLGLSSKRAHDRYLDGMRWVMKRSSLSSICHVGPSPHAPYSFRMPYFGKAWKSPFPIAIHVAESEAEVELLARHSGPFVPFLAERGAWDPSGLAWSPEHAIELANGARHLLLIHCNYLNPNAAIGENATIVYCPRTHAAFGHKPHPFRQFLERGVRVCLGTDSLASNPDLDILAEARFVHRLYPDFAPATLLRMITLSGAEALGWSNEAGSLESGKSADLVAVPLPNAESADPHALILDSDLRVSAVMFRGAWLNLN